MFLFSNLARPLIAACYSQETFMDNHDIKKNCLPAYARPGFASVLLAMALLTITIAGCAGLSKDQGGITKAYVGNFKDGTVSVIDVASRQVIATIPVSSGPHGMAITPDGRFVYISSDGSSVVSVIDTSTDRVMGVIEVGSEPHGLAMTPDGRELWVAVKGTDKVEIIDTRGNQVVGNITVVSPHNIAFRPDGKSAYVASQVSGNNALVEVDVKDRRVLRRVPLDKTPRALDFDSDGRHLYFTEASVNAVLVLDPVSNEIVAKVPVGASPHHAKFMAGGAKNALVVSQDTNELAVINLTNNQVVKTFQTGKNPHWIASGREGRIAYITNEGANSVSIIDLGTGYAKTVAVGSAPRKIVIQP